MVIVGGLTRLTNSGLSITEWELIKGILPPLNDQQWGNYFLLYKQIPQYQLVNSNMSLQEFKVIFYWEYFHRVLGRLIGVFFLVPLIYFYITDKINKEYLKVCFIILFLIIFQGFIGWYMVKSGLVNNISVSHYRLSLHLSIAFIIISLIFWMLLNVRFRKFNIFFNKKKKSYIFQILIFLIFFQIIFGAFVSGLDAGRIYQTWPLMNNTYFPDDVSLVKFKDLIDFNNHGLVQFYHRNIAYIIVVYILITGFYVLKLKNNNLNKSFFLVSIILILQIALGVTTLTSGLNIYLASAHQISSLFLILSVINLYYNYIN
tara:strand:- start:607 stop:1557 length:951 start_codon:yes stop_codon:yes gene_type:complete